MLQEGISKKSFRGTGLRGKKERKKERKKGKLCSISALTLSRPSPSSSSSSPSHSERRAAICSARNICLCTFVIAAVEELEDGGDGDRSRVGDGRGQVSFFKATLIVWGRGIIHLSGFRASNCVESNCVYSPFCIVIRDHPYKTFALRGEVKKYPKFAEKQYLKCG